MKALLLGLATAWALGAGAQAQTIQPLPEPPASIAQDVQSLGLVDTIAVWPIDWNADGLGDALVQVAIATGGNSVALAHRIYVGQPGGYVAVGEVDLPEAGIRAVSQTGPILTIDLFVYLADDARCCPSGTRTVTLQP